MHKPVTRCQRFMNRSYKWILSQLTVSHAINSDMCWQPFIRFIIKNKNNLKYIGKVFCACLDDYSSTLTRWKIIIGTQFPLVSSHWLNNSTALAHWASWLAETYKCNAIERQVYLSKVVFSYYGSSWKWYLQNN